MDSFPNRSDSRSQCRRTGYSRTLIREPSSAENSHAIRAPNCSRSTSHEISVCHSPQHPVPQVAMTSSSIERLPVVIGPHHLRDGLEHVAQSLHLERARHRLTPGRGIDEDRGQHVVVVISLLGPVELDPLHGKDRRSLTFLWWLPLSAVVGFLVANRFLSESWPLAQAIPLAVVLATPFGVGAHYGLRAVRLGEAKGWIGLALNVLFMLIALVMPITEALS